MPSLRVQGLENSYSKEYHEIKIWNRSWKVLEVEEMVRISNPDVIIFDEVLKPSQQYNIASLCRIEVMDCERCNSGHI